MLEKSIISGILYALRLINLVSLFIVVTLKLSNENSLYLARAHISTFLHTYQTSIELFEKRLSSNGYISTRLLWVTDHRARSLISTDFTLPPKFGWPGLLPPQRSWRIGLAIAIFPCPPLRPGPPFSRISALQRISPLFCRLFCGSSLFASLHPPPDADRSSPFLKTAESSLQRIS